jgi:hypothetical protein
MKMLIIWLGINLNHFNRTKTYAIIISENILSEIFYEHFLSSMETVQNFSHQNLRLQSKSMLTSRRVEMIWLTF